MLGALQFITAGLVSLVDPVHILVILVCAFAAKDWCHATLFAVGATTLIQAVIGWSPELSPPAVVFPAAVTGLLSVGVAHWRKVKRNNLERPTDG